MEDSRREAEDPIEACDCVFKALQASKEHTPVVVVSQDFDGFSPGLNFGHWLFNQSESVLVALGFETKFGKAVVEAGHLFLA